MSKKLFWTSYPREYKNFVCMQDLSLYGKPSDYEVEKETTFGKIWVPLTYGTMLEDSARVRTVNKISENNVKEALEDKEYKLQKLSGFSRKNYKKR
jgi:hypothetical protein